MADTACSASLTATHLAAQVSWVIHGSIFFSTRSSNLISPRFLNRWPLLPHFLTTFCNWWQQKAVIRRSLCSEIRPLTRLSFMWLLAFTSILAAWAVTWKLSKHYLGSRKPIERSSRSTSQWWLYCKWYGKLGINHQPALADRRCCGDNRDCSKTQSYP